MSQKIIIIGAGIAGLTAGILLRQHGFEVAIYEKQSSIMPYGGGLGIWPNGVRVLKKLPCAEKISLLPATITEDLFADAKGHTLAVLPREFFLQVNGSPIMNVCRSELHHLLANEFGIENISFGTKCIAIQQENNKVIAHFENHALEKADLLIGADGAYSTVRKIIFPETNLTYSGYMHFLGVLQYAAQKHRHHFIFGKNRYCLQFPISRDRHIFYQVLPYQQGKISQKKTRQERINLFKGWSNEVDELIAAYEQSLNHTEFNFHFYCEEAYTMRPLSRWHDRQVVLLGDAAHPIGSVMGFGAGCGLEDCDVLVNYLKNLTVAEALVSYEQKQIPRMIPFYQMEKNMTDFILGAGHFEYLYFLSELKNKKAFAAHNQELVKCLQG